MAEEKRFGPTLILVIGGLFVLNAVNNAFSGDKPTPSPSKTSKPQSSTELTPPDSWLMTRAKREVKAGLKDPDSAIFGSMHVRRYPALVVCGTVNSRNSFGGMSGSQRFISGAVTALEEQMAAGEMEKIWARVC